MQKKQITSYLSPSFEESGLRRVYEMSNLAVRYFALGGILVYFYYLVLDIGSMHLINVFLRLAILMTILASLFLSYRKNMGDVSRVGFQLLGVLICALEIETQFHPSPLDLPDPNFPFQIYVWLAFPMILLFYMIFLIYKPILGISIWSLPLIFYTIRSLIYTDFHLIHEMQNTITYSFVAYTMGSVFHIYVFKSRYTVYLNEKRLQAEYETRLQLTYELEQERARKQVLDDMHDHLGADLLDLVILSKSLSNKPMSNIIKIDCDLMVSKLEKLYKNLREQIFHSEIDKFLKEEFWGGIRLYLLNRYDSSSRSVIVLFMPEEVFETEKLFSSLEKQDKLFGIIKELSSNDLKYGTGQSKWNFNLQSEFIHLNFEASPATAVNALNGRGSKTIQDRIHALGGEIINISHNGHFKLDFKVPAQ
jgi:hypothetical protein